MSIYPEDLTADMFRNPLYLENGNIWVEFNHPNSGWRAVILPKNQSDQYELSAWNIVVAMDPPAYVPPEPAGPTAAMVRNPVFDAMGGISCEVLYREELWVPFTARADDAEQYGRQIHALALAMGPAPYVAPPEPDPPTAEELLETERATMVVSRFQAQEALIDAGLYDAAVAAVAAEGGRTQRAWEGENNFRRDSPTINAMAAVLGLSDTQVDDLFRAAMAIRA